MSSFILEALGNRGAEVVAREWSRKVCTCAYGHIQDCKAVPTNHRLKCLLLRNG